MITSKPTTKSLTLLLERLRPLRRHGHPGRAQLQPRFSRPGTNNDLTDLARRSRRWPRRCRPPRRRPSQSLQESMPITAFVRPLLARPRGHAAHLRAVRPPSMTPTATTRTSRPCSPTSSSGENNNLTPAHAAAGPGTSRAGQLRRCPGAATQPAADGSSPFVDGEPAQLRPDRGALMTAPPAARSPAARC